ncbi:MAG: hypothetical protein GY757_58960, partial [bacterium]|nr:hypothetical protein [bacterium]
QYATALFKRNSIEKYVTYFQEIAAAVVENPNMKLKEISVSHNLVTADTSVETMEFGF